jgi:hypothetical protein
VAVRTNPDGSVTEIPPEHFPNRHALPYRNVLVAHWPKPGSGKLVRAWHCLTCKETIYDDRSASVARALVTLVSCSRRSATTTRHVTRYTSDWRAPASGLSQFG